MIVKELRIKVPKGNLYTDAIEEPFLASRKKLFKKKNLRKHFNNLNNLIFCAMERFHECLKVLNGTINTNKEPIFLRARWCRYSIYQQGYAKH